MQCYSRRSTDEPGGIILNKSKTVKVRVPATTANCGPGFDALGIACNFYNELELTLLEEDSLKIEVFGEGADIFLPMKRTLSGKS